MSSSHAFSSFVIAAILLLAAPALAADVTVTLGAGDGFAIKDNTGTIERLRVDEATGNVSRNGALFVHTTGSPTNLFIGAGAGNLGTGGFRNSAFGQDALGGNTTGAKNTAAGYNALEINTTGNSNSAFGTGALFANTTGNDNSAFGEYALALNSTGRWNSAFGFRALTSNTTGVNSSAFGGLALYLSKGSSNSAFGYSALKANYTGGNNAAFGNSALANSTTGSSNVAMGIYAGQNQTTGSNNIYIANQGVAAESGRIKIGTVGTHTQTTVAGIHGATSSSGIAVLVNASGTLGTTTSSVRFKQDVRDMASASDVLLKLRPVTFHYREEAVGAAEARTTQYGLIAEEVAAVAPELVAPDAEGKPYSVKYHELPALLVNEFQQQQRTIEALQARVAELEKRSPVTAEVAAR